MKEHDFARKLASRLDRAPVSPEAAARLRKAREAAVARAVAKAEPVSATKVGHTLVFFWHEHRAACIGLLLAVLVAMAGSAWQWQRTRAVERALEIELLADDVPVEFLLSDRTEQWMRR